MLVKKKKNRIERVKNCFPELLEGTDPDSTNLPTISQECSENVSVF